MLATQDVERGQDYRREYDDSNDIVEREALLPTPSLEPSKLTQNPYLHFIPWSQPRFGLLHLIIVFFAGAITCLTAQYALSGSSCFNVSQRNESAMDKTDATVLAPPYAGSTEIHHFPPMSPTNAYPSMFPTNVGYPGGTPTGAEPALVATGPSYPRHTGAAQLIVPSFSQPAKKGKGFDLFKKWGNLSPWYSVDRQAFGLDSAPEPPEGCGVTGLHLLHRHGARYPTAWASYGSPADFARSIHRSTAHWNASGDLSFMNEWTYKLGEEVLTPFGRQQLFDLGISMRLKYGFLLKNFTESNTIPVFRTESQDRMLNSAINFALGFFGHPLDHQYQQSITIEAPGFNNTLAPYSTCPNAEIPSKSERALPYVKQWTSIYLKEAQARLQPQLRGYDLSIEDVYVFQKMCAYETVALGYSKFCELFTEEEWEGFGYSLDLHFWYNSGFGSPVARVQGIGYTQELIARLTHTSIETHNSSTNSTLDDSPITFPLGQSLYVDATHEVVVLNVITALNLSNFATSGPLPADHIPPNLSFRASELAPFATNIQFQLLSCASVPGPQIRIIINDGVTPLTGIKGCPEQRDGMCPLETFISSQKEIIHQTDWNYHCHGDWEVPEGTAWNTTTGDPPKAL